MNVTNRTQSAVPHTSSPKKSGPESLALIQSRPQTNNGGLLCSPCNAFVSGETLANKHPHLDAPILLAALTSIVIGNRRHCSAGIRDNYSTDRNITDAYQVIHNGFNAAR